MQPKSHPVTIARALENAFRLLQTGNIEAAAAHFEHLLQVQVWLNLKQMLKMGRRRLDVSGLKQPKSVLQCSGNRYRMAFRLHGMCITFQSRYESERGGS